MDTGKEWAMRAIDDRLYEQLRLIDHDRAYEESQGTNELYVITFSKIHIHVGIDNTVSMNKRAENIQKEEKVKIRQHHT